MSDLGQARQTLQALRQQGLDALHAALGSDEALQHWKKDYLNRKKGLLAPFYRQIRDLPADQRSAFGALINEVLQTLEAAWAQRPVGAEAAASWQGDPTAPVYPAAQGGYHPLTIMRRRIEKIFGELGFSIARGPHIETEFYNFNALNIPAYHPAREMQDTFYVDLPPKRDGNESFRYLLRTHTSPVQIRYMQDHQPPIRMIAPGRVFRCDSDITHSPMFQQVEGLWIEEGVSFVHMRGILRHFLSRLFRRELAIRLRPSYFPFTEPSAEVDMACVFCDGKGCRVCSDSGWIEVLGAGMVHPNVLEAGGLDPRLHNGLAFGIGVERLTMLYYGINDIRHLYRGALPFLRQFEGESL